MANGDITIGAEYWRLTVYDWQEILGLGIGEEGGPDEPLKFKIYQNAERIPLTQQVPLRIGSVRSALASPQENLASGLRGGRMSHETLSALLYYSYGLSRLVLGPLNIWPYHRFVASARCFFPTELYVWISDSWGMSAGLYHYDELHHALVCLRYGDHREVLSAALGAHLEGTDCVIVLSSLFWKTAFRYRHYAYRLCTQEAGLVAGNILQTARVLGLTGHVHYQFLDEPLNRLLGLIPGEESTMSVIPLYPWRRADHCAVHPRRDCFTRGDSIFDLPTLTARYLDVPIEKDKSLWSHVLKIDDNSRLTETSAFARFDFNPMNSPAEDGTVVPVPPDTAEEPDMATALHRRHSGGILFGPQPESISAGTFARLVRCLPNTYPSDIGDSPFVQCFVLVRSVDDVPPGLYRLSSDGTRLHRLVAAPVHDLLERLAVIPPSVNVHAASAVIYLLGDHTQALAQLGNRSYRILTHDAGIVAQRLAVAAGSVSLAARVHNGWDACAIERTLGLPERGFAPLFQCVVGARRVTSHYEAPISF